MSWEHGLSLDAAFPVLCEARRAGTAIGACRASVITPKSHPTGTPGRNEAAERRPERVESSLMPQAGGRIT